MYPSQGNAENLRIAAMYMDNKLYLAQFRIFDMLLDRIGSFEGLLLRVSKW